MLKTLTLRNFQAHKKLELELDPHVTTIIGASDVGKSAIIRALYWLTFNRPSGESFKRHNTKVTSVTLTVDSYEIKRKRGKSNQYCLGGSPLSAFGSGVPDEVSKVLCMSAINFQQQHDGPFWFTENPGQVAKNLNSIVDLSVIDSVTTNIGAKIKRAGASVEACQERIIEARGKVSQLKWVGDCDVVLQELEAKEKHITQANEYTRELRFLLGSAANHRATIKTAVEVKEHGSKLVEVGDRVLGLTKQGSKLEEHLNKIKSIQIEVESCRAEIESLKETIQRETNGRCPICQGPLKMGL